MYLNLSKNSWILRIILREFQTLIFQASHLNFHFISKNNSITLRYTSNNIDDICLRNFQHAVSYPYNMGKIDIFSYKIQYTIFFYSTYRDRSKTQSFLILKT